MKSRIVKAISLRARKRRAQLFRDLITIRPGSSVLDLGGNRGEHIAELLPGHQNITIADLGEEVLREAAAKGYKTLLLDGSTKLPIENGAYDVLFCSSVIEHVTGPKEKVIAERSNKLFKKMAWETQTHFASEIRRISKSYFVQTPYRYFPVESHSLLPMPIIFLPRPMLAGLLALGRRFWIKRTKPDWNLLSIKQMQNLFPDAEIYFERSGGMIKSLIAVKNK